MVIIRINTCNWSNIRSIGISRITTASMVGCFIPFIFCGKDIGNAMSGNSRSSVYTEKITRVDVVAAEQICTEAFIARGKVIAELGCLIPAHFGSWNISARPVGTLTVSVARTSDWSTCRCDKDIPLCVGYFILANSVLITDRAGAKWIGFSSGELKGSCRDY